MFGKNSKKTDDPAGEIPAGERTPDAPRAPAVNSANTGAHGKTEPLRMQSAPDSTLPQPKKAPAQAVGPKDRFDVIHEHIMTISGNQQALSKGQNALSKNQQTLSKNQQTAFARITQAQEKVDKLEEQLKKLEEALGKAKARPGEETDVRAEFLAALDDCIARTSKEVGNS